eukprot:3649022-Alexandrium_andersonii.AAC.1
MPSSSISIPTPFGQCNGGKEGVRWLDWRSCARMRLAIPTLAVMAPRASHRSLPSARARQAASESASRCSWRS